MKYFLDTEFLEGPQKTWLGTTKPTIDLISIAVVSEDNREYYAISKDFNLKEAWDRWQPDRDCSEFEKEYWIRENVLKPIYYNWIGKDVNFHEIDFTYKDFKKLLNKYGKTNKQIAEEIKQFVYQPYIDAHPILFSNDLYPKDIQFYGYYSAYDWVVVCWLFGKMIDLPKGFPSHCVDLKQTLDEKASAMFPELLKEKALEVLKAHPNSEYPKQTNAHNALSDARWVKQLYQFLESL